MPQRIMLCVLLLLVGIHETSKAQLLDPVLFEIPRPFAPPDVRGLSELFRVSFGTGMWGDVEGDGRFDLLIMGLHPSDRTPVIETLLLHNLGYDFSDVPRLTFSGTSLPERVWLSSAAWADADADGLLDLAFIGATNTRAPYENAGSIYLGRISPTTHQVTYGQIALPLEALNSGSVSWADYDNDGDQDLLATGLNSLGEPTTRLFELSKLDDGTLRTTPRATDLPGVAFGGASWADYDGDADQDVLITGMRPNQSFVVALYRNDGGGAFTQVDAGFLQLAYSNAAWGDYDSDGDLDLAVLGGYPGPRILQGDLAIYRNDGGAFSPVRYDDLTGVFAGDLQWVDYDANGTLDLSVTGATNLFFLYKTYVYQNVDFGADMVAWSIDPRPLENVTAVQAPGLRNSSISWADYDQDRDLDVFLTGQTRKDSTVTVLYQSLLIDIPPGEHGDDSAANDPPTAPIGLQTEVSARNVTLRWEAATDTDTPSPGLTYNVRVGTTPGGIDVMPPMADPETGRRQVMAIGNAGSNLFWRLKALLPGTYYWSVQAIDPGDLGSPFAPEATFVIQ